MNSEKTCGKAPFNPGKFAQKMRERRARRRAAGIKPNRRLEDCLSHAYIRRQNVYLRAAAWLAAHQAGS